MTLVVLAFACLGFLIGNLVGLSAESTLAVIIPLLFSFGGGSAVAFLPKLALPDRQQAAAAVIALSIACLAGAYFGIFISEHQLLSPASLSVKRQSSIGEMKYLRAFDMRDVDTIDQQYRTHVFGAEKAYELLHKLVSSRE
jgi:hypothetical protein